MEERAMGRPGIRRRPDAPGEGNLCTQPFMLFAIQLFISFSIQLFILFCVSYYLYKCPCCYAKTLCVVAIIYLFVYRSLYQGEALEEVWVKEGVSGIEVGRKACHE